MWLTVTLKKGEGGDMIDSYIRPFVFISYSRDDAEFVARLKTDLQTQGINIWIDREGIQPGTPNWEEALRTAIRAAQAVLLIASPHSRSSRYVNDELRIAEMYQRPVYPIWMTGTQWMEAIPIGWGGTQYIDAREARYSKALPEITMAIRVSSSTVPLTPSMAQVQDFEPRNPYKGLRAFSSKDSRDFFGRDMLIDELVSGLEGTLAVEKKSNLSARLLAVVGPSGSGKSSVVMAGLLPYLQNGGVLDSKEWVYLDPIVPGRHPVESLALTLWEKLSNKSLKAIREDLEDESVRGLHLLTSSLAKQQGTKVVLFVDQFEELFTQTVSEEERRRFIDLLVAAITESHGPVIVILTLRADFYDRPMQYPQPGKLIEERDKSVFPMETNDLRAVIEKPAALPDVQLAFEGDLVGDLLFEVRGETGALPLLQFTLDQFFQRRSAHLLTLGGASRTSENGKADYGAGIDNIGTLNLLKSIVSGNTAIGTNCSGNDACNGGGIGNAGILIVTNSTVFGNKSDFGGGIANVGTVYFSDSTVSGNIANVEGGGIYNDRIMTLHNSTISDNTSSMLGGGLYNGQILTITNSTISSNKTDADGGGIYNEGPSNPFSAAILSLTNSTISINTAKDKGGGIDSPGETSITYCTVYGNAARYGGGISIRGSGTLAVKTSIIAGDNASSGPDVFGLVTLLYPNLIQNISGAEIVFGSDPHDRTINSLTRKSIFGKSPNLGPLQDNEGPTQTHALLPGSPAIDQIPLLSTPGASGSLCGFNGLDIFIDQRNAERPSTKVMAAIWAPTSTHETGGEASIHLYWLLRISIRKSVV
jgi:TIR domain